MLINKTKRRLSHNLIISKYFDEENTEIQNQYFIRNVADELSIISLNFGGFFVVINPCSFAIEYSTETFYDMNNINLVEVKQFEAKAATVFRIDNQKKMPKFDFDYLKNNLQSEEQLTELEKVISEITGVNNQYSLSQTDITMNFDSIELDVDMLNSANYKHLEVDEYKMSTINEEADELVTQIAKRKQELEILNEQLANKENKLENELNKIEVDPTKTYIEATKELAKMDDILNDKGNYIDPDDLFAEIENNNK